MPVEEKIEDKIQKTEKKLLELSVILKRLDREYQKLLDEMELPPEQLKAYVENSENFSPPIWEQLQNEKKKLDERLNLELSCIPDLSKTKKSLAEKGAVQQHWLYVR